MCWITWPDSRSLKQLHIWNLKAVRYTAFKEARPWFVQSEIISSNFLPIGPVQVARVPRCSASSQLPECGKAASGTTIGLPSLLFHWDRGDQSTSRHLAGAGQGRHCLADATGSVGRVRLSRPRHTSPSSWGILRPRWCCVELVQIIPWRSYPIHTLRQTVIRSDSVHLRCPTGIGPWTDPLSALHSRRSATDWEAQPASTRIRRWHAGVRLLLTFILLELRELMSACLDEVWSWMWSNRLQLNTSKTEVLWCAMSRRQDRRGHGTACRHLSQRYLRWRPLGVSWRWNCLSEAFLISTALSTTASDSYSISSSASQSRFVTVFNVCTVSLQSFDITPPKSFLLIIIIIINAGDRTMSRTDRFH